MTTKTTTKTVNINGITVKVTVERGTWVEEIMWDGYNTGRTQTHLVDRTLITVSRDGTELTSDSSINPLPARHSQLEAAKKAGCVAMIGSSFIKPETANIIRQALAECTAENPKTPEMITLENEAAEREEAERKAYAMRMQEQRELEAMPGYCKKCHSFCYGDCQSN